MRQISDKMNKMWEKFQDRRRSFRVTVEPLAILYPTACALVEVIRSSLIVQKICQNKLNYTSEVCGNLTNDQPTLEEVQRHVTDYEALRGSLALAPL